MADLKTNYVDDVLDTTKNQLRKYQQIQNDDGTVSFVDVTEYTQVGTSFGAKDINDTNAAINDVNGKLTDFLLFKIYNSEPFNINANEAKDIVIHYDSIFGYKAVACIGFSNNKSNGIFVSQSGFAINSVIGASGMFSAWCFNCTQSKNFSDVILSSCVVYIKA